MTAHPLIGRLQAQAEAFVALRRDLHQHPELGLAEMRTSQLVAEGLAAWGYEVHRGLATTGVVGTLRRGTGGKRLGLRADMDALPIHECSGKPWASRHAGVMHACGHDGHTAMLLAAARHLAEQSHFDGTLHLIFQPAEEHPGGAKLMIEQGLFERFPCDAVFAMHNMPGTPQGHFVLRDGPAMASSDDVTITLHGVGGHGAMPHRATDPVVAAADGRVVYAGAGLRGYGNLVILKHNNTYLTAYAHNQTLLVKEDQTVRKGQKIAEMGNSDADRVKLHFEIRRQGKPVDPAKYLPPR